MYLVKWSASKKVNWTKMQTRDKRYRTVYGRNLRMFVNKVMCVPGKPFQPGANVIKLIASVNYEFSR